MRRISIIVFASLISACAHVDTGQVDYRVADPFKPDAASGAKLRDCKTSEKPCPWHADLDRKYVAAHAPFVANNVYSVELEQAFIGKNLLEGHILGRQFGKHGEYAILANAFEFGADEASKFIQAPEYGGEKASENNTKLKLVYYGDDIAKRQPFNFSNIPLMPRAVYGGGSVGIQIVVMEIDAQAGPVTSLLGTLAEFGKNSIPGPPGATDILFALGDSLLKGSQDDRLFDYRFVLSNGASIAADGSLGPVATFAPGRYVFRRRDERVTTMNWDDLKFNHNTGRLYRLGANGYDEVRDEFYLVLNIRKYSDNTLPETYAFSDWTAFRSVVQGAADAKGAPLEAVRKNFVSLLGFERSRQWKAELVKRWGAATTTLQNYSTRTVGLTEGADLSTCPAERRRALARDVAERDVHDAVRAFLADYQLAHEATTGEQAEAQPEFKPEDREALVSMVARYFMPWADDSKANFANSGAFESAFFGAGTGDLMTLATTTAASRSASVSDCDQLTSRLANL